MSCEYCKLHPEEYTCSECANFGMDMNCISENREPCDDWECPHCGFKPHPKSLMQMLQEEMADAV